VRDEPGIGRHGKHNHPASGYALQPQAGCTSVACIASRMMLVTDPGAHKGGSVWFVADMKTIQGPLHPAGPTPNLTKQAATYVRRRDRRRAQGQYHAPGLQKAHRNPSPVTPLSPGLIGAGQLVHPGLPVLW